MLACAAAARADGTCRLVEISFQPAANLQIAVWIEDAQGHYVDTAWVTRATGALGLANRPGNALFKSAYRWPYGRRVMVLPVWAHARNHTYGYVTMGGAAGTNGDDSIGYHEAVSSNEPFYCPPSLQPLDAVSCASPFVGSKGVYAPGLTSLYPPRADLTSFRDGFDSADARTFAAANDLAAISGATPPPDRVIDPPIQWVAPPSLPNGRYVVRVEASLESDFNAAHRHPSFPDVNTELDSFGREPFGQPSIVYSVPILVDGSAQTATSNGWDGYGSWDGSSGALTQDDGSITDAPGTGAGRLEHVASGNITWRLKAVAGGCTGCVAPQATGALGAKAADTTIALDFTAPLSTSALDAPRRYEIRYRAGPLDDASFADGIPADSAPPPGAPGATQQVTLTGLKGETTYRIGVRALNACGAPSPIQYASATTLKQKFVTLHGCFIATAAFGTPLARELGPLRAFRDRHLLTNPLGQIATAVYYSLSPPIARALAADDRLRALARRAIAPAVTLARAWLLTEDAVR
ncbi:MAG TPA: CFI-box-CTERM domain-containing protein [Polyangia bacterium]|nr:CFI-box-CTERM domain-containing protein [Polyangia bacterium]